MVVDQRSHTSAGADGSIGVVSSSAPRLQATGASDVRCLLVILSVLFPPVCLGCRLLLRTSTSPLPLCTTCLLDHVELPRTLVTVDGVQAAYAYAGAFARAVTALKLEGDLELAAPLGRLLARAPIVCERVWDVIVPVPLHPMRAWIRGFNQAALLGEWLARTLPRGRRPRIDQGALARVRHTAPQAGLSALERWQNVAKAFTLRRPDHIHGRRVLVLDDVTTTGATLRGCMDQLRDAGPGELGALALLRTVA